MILDDHMSVITLTTDLGVRDYYVASIKGQILKEAPNAIIVDISHEIIPFNVLDAAFILKNCYHEFPEGSIHVVSVDSLAGENIEYLIVEKDRHFFIGTDNGLFSIMFEGSYDNVYKIKTPEGQQGSTFPVKEVFAGVAGFLFKGGNILEVADKVVAINERMTLQPISRGGYIQGSIIYIDSFQNIITNISLSLFERIGEGRPFHIYFRRREYVEEISKNYNDVPEGEVLALFGRNGLLELAINKDKARDLLGIDIGHSIQVEFYDYSHS